MDLSPETLLKLRRDLDALRLRIEELRDAIQGHSRTVREVEESRGRRELATSEAERVSAVVSFDQRTLRDVQVELNRQYRIQNSMRWAMWFAFLAAIAYAAFAGVTYWQIARQYPKLEESADAAKSAADTAASQLELAERPWVDASIRLDGPLTFDADGANIPLKIVLRNTGHSPALSTFVSAFPLVGSEGANAIRYRRQVCQAATKTTFRSQLGFALFPNANYEERLGVGISRKEIEKDKASKEFPGSHFGEAILWPSVVVCVAYRPTFNHASVYRTAYIVDLLRIDSAGRVGVGFKIGENVDEKHLRLRLHPLGAITAN